MTPFIRARIHDLNQAIEAFRQDDTKAAVRIVADCHAALGEKLAPDAPKLGSTCKIGRADAVARLSESINALSARGVDHERAMDLMSQVVPVASQPKRSRSKPADEKPAPAKKAEE